MVHTFAVLNATESDASTLATCFFDAFLDAAHPQSPFYQQMFPRTPSVHAFYETSFVEQMRRQPDAVFLKVIDTSANGKIAGFIKWTPPGAEESFWSDPGPDVDPELMGAFFGAMEANRAKLMERRRHWFIELMAVDAKYARQGAGAMLIDYGCKLADRDGLEAYVDASPLAKSLYERYGFETKNTTTMPKPFDWYVEAFMIRPKKTAVS